MFSNQRFLHLSTFSLLTSHYGWIITPNLSDGPIADTPLAARMRLLQPAGNTHRIQALLLSACTSREITASISPSCSKQTRRLSHQDPMKQQTPRSRYKILRAMKFLRKLRLGCHTCYVKVGLRLAKTGFCKIK